MSITIRPGLAIDESELRFTASRSSGPGGQNVNKLNTRVTLRFDLLGSPSLSPDQKELLRTRLAGRLSRRGLLLVVCQRHRSQVANRLEAVDKFTGLLRAALSRRRPRRPTTAGAGARERRLTEKKIHGRTKSRRSWQPGPED